jgi:hypothetical protein
MPKDLNFDLLRNKRGKQPLPTYVDIVCIPLPSSFSAACAVNCMSKRNDKKYSTLFNDL